ncbi:MAG: glucose-6-phosphate dehydrogenase, partial [Halanaerobiaceae bacterium]
MNTYNLQSKNKFDDKSQIIIFGGTGDLAHRKIFPGLYNLINQNQLPDNFSVFPVGRSYKNNKEYKEGMYKAVKQYSRFELTEENWQNLADRIYYQRFNFTNESGYKKLKKNLSNSGNRIFYLAVAPEYFGLIVEQLYSHNLINSNTGEARLVIEKPFGHDLESARKLNKKIRKVFPENNIYRIDHYLGKEMLQNILVIRFANIFFEPIWNNKYIDNIQIISSEKSGVGQRGNYYDRAGALKDMLQNHMMQLLTLTAMEPPGTMETESIRNEKVKILQALMDFQPDNIENYVVRGQYGQGEIDGKKVKGYKEESGIESGSSTETFVALKTYINNLRWDGVPFYIKTGKRLTKKSTEIIVEFKSRPHPAYMKNFPELKSNLLIIRVQPLEGVCFQFNAKQPGTRQNIIPVQMDFCQNCNINANSPEAYERLILDMIKGDPTLFTRWDEVEYSWKFIDKIAGAWDNIETDFPDYKAGTSGPEAADKLLERDGRKWWHIDPHNMNGDSIK